ncbi:MAG: PAS domain-containing protein [Vicinamibacterales bacterium]
MITADRSAPASPLLGSDVWGGIKPLLDAMPEFVTIASLDGPAVYVNPAARRALGIAPATEVATLLEFRPPGYARHLREVILVVAEREGMWRGETDFVTRSGEVRRVFETTVTYATADGAHYVASIARDLTAADREAEAARKTEERTRFALEAARAGVWEADLRTGRATWSESMRAVQGFVGEEFGGTLESFLALVHPADRATVRQALDPGIEHPRDFCVEFRTLWPDGTTHWIESHGHVLSDEAGRPARVLAMAQDVTERKVLETQLLQAQKIEALGQLAGGLAHDFNNLLTAILGYGKLLQADLGEDDPRHADAGEIVKAGERAAELTRQLLAFSRRQILQPTTIDLNELISGLNKMLSRLIGEHIEIALKLNAGPTLVRGDHAQVEQVLVNMAVNARDAMEDGGTLTVVTTVLELSGVRARQLGLTPGPYVVLRMSDTGIGMSEETKSHIFEPFFTTKERGKGTGLGLATAFGTIKQSGGTIEVTSELGRGTEFDVYLPATAESAQASASVEAKPALAGGSETILLVEDEPAVRTLAQNMLLRSGYVVLTAGRPDEVTRLVAEAGPIDLLLTDVVMPGSTGPEVYARLRARRPGLRVLYMSGFSAGAIAHHGVGEGSPFLQKPFSAPDLIRKVREALDDRRPAAAPR